MKVTMMLLAGLLSFQIARTAAADACSGNICQHTTVARLTPNGDPQNTIVLVQPTDGGQAALSCTVVSGIYLSLHTTNPLFGWIYETLLQATIHNKKVWLRVLPGSSDCEIIYVVLENS